MNNYKAKLFLCKKITSSSLDNSLHHINPDAPIGIFDSGVGGLTVADAIAKYLPEEQIIYFGDTAHLPYGDKSARAIQHYSVKIADFLLEKGCKLIVIACNTASSVAYYAVKKHIQNRALLLEVIEPVVEAATKENLHKIGVIATNRTIQSGMYPLKLQQKQTDLKVADKATQSLVVIIEEGLFHNKKVMKQVVRHYLDDKEFNNIDGLILGCTHYPIIKKDIKKYFKQYRPKRRVKIFDSTDTVAEKVKQVLTEQNLLNKNNKTPAHRFYVSDYTEGFERIARNFFQQQDKEIKLEHYALWDV